jgi:hypothetical protein
MPAEYQAGQELWLGGGTGAMAVRCAVLPGALGQAGAIAGLLCVVLAGFGDVVVEGHGLLLRWLRLGGWQRWMAVAPGPDVVRWAGEALLRGGLWPDVTAGQAR